MRPSPTDRQLVPPPLRLPVAALELGDPLHVLLLVHVPVAVLVEDRLDEVVVVGPADRVRDQPRPVRLPAGPGRRSAARRLKLYDEVRDNRTSFRELD